MTSKQLLGLYNLFVEVFDYNATSDVVTPLELAREMVRGLPTTGTMLVPASGIGTFAVAAVLEGRDPCTITCVEYNKAYSAIASRILERFGIKCVNVDFLSWEPNMQFDVIIGNPPFQKGGNSAFYTQFFRKTGDLLKKDGCFSLISPSKAAAKYSKGYKELAKLGLNSIEYGVDSWFPNIEQPVVIYSGSTKSAEAQKLTVRDGTTQKKVNRDVILPVQYVSSTKAFKEADAGLTLSIFEKFFAKDEKLKNRFETLEQAPNSPYVYLAAVAWRYHPQRPKGGPYALLATVNQHDQYLNGKFMRFETEYEAEQMQWLLSRSMLYRFVAAASCRAKFLPRVLVEETPDYVGITSDEGLFKAVGLTKEEISYLEMWNEVTA